MTFRVPRVNVVESDEGFSIEIVSPTEIRYSENGATWQISSEYLADDAMPLVIYRDTVKPLDTGSRPPLLPHRGDEMIKNIRRAFRFRGVEIQVM